MTILNNFEYLILLCFYWLVINGRGRRGEIGGEVGEEERGVGMERGRGNLESRWWVGKEGAVVLSVKELWGKRHRGVEGRIQGWGEGGNGREKGNLN